MPIYEYRCKECGYGFEKFCRTFKPSRVNCPSCYGTKVERLLFPSLFRMGKSSEPTSEFTAKDAEVNYYKDRRDYGRAANAAERAGKSEWEMEELYRKAGRRT